jgi:hypothetical protein
LRSVDREALVVGMTLVPGLVSRNRSFALFEDPEVRRARSRSSLLRGIVRQLAGVQGKVEALDVVRGSGACELRYRMPGLRMQRRAVLNEVEYACVAYLLGRSGFTGLQASDEDRGRIDGALHRLAAGLELSEIEAGHVPVV